MRNKILPETQFYAPVVRAAISVADGSVWLPRRKQLNPCHPLTANSDQAACPPNKLKSNSPRTSRVTAT
jgi:hypothetical protein